MGRSCLRAVSWLDWDIYSTCVSGPVSTWIYAVCGCSGNWERGGRGANILLQGLILGLGTLAVMEVTKSKQGAILGNTEAERLFRAASAMQAVVRPGETRGFPTAPSVTFTAVLGVGEAGVGGGESGSHPSSRPGLWLCISSLLLQRV